MIFVMFVCLFDYVFVVFTSKCFYLLFVCFIHVLSLELEHGRSLGLVGLMKEAFQAKGCKLGVFTSRQGFFLSRLVTAFTSRDSEELQLFSFEQFSYFGHNFFYRHPNEVIQVVMKGCSEDKVIWNDENALEITALIKSCNPLFKGYLSNCNFF